MAVSGSGNQRSLWKVASTWRTGCHKTPFHSSRTRWKEGGREGGREERERERERERETERQTDRDTILLFWHL